MLERSQKLIYSKFRKSQLSTKKFLSWMILGREDFWVHKVMTESWILVVWLWCKQWLQNIACMKVPEKFVHVYEPASQDEASRCELCKKISAEFCMYVYYSMHIWRTKEVETTLCISLWNAQLKILKRQCRLKTNFFSSEWCKKIWHNNSKNNLTKLNKIYENSCFCVWRHTIIIMGEQENISKQYVSRIAGS